MCPKTQMQEENRGYCRTPTIRSLDGSMLALDWLLVGLYHSRWGEDFMLHGSQILHQKTLRTEVSPSALISCYVGAS